MAISLIAAAPALLGTVFAYLNRRALKTPSGDKIGEVVERTHDMAAVNAAHIAQIDRTVNGEPGTAENEPTA